MDLGSLLSSLGGGASSAALSKMLPRDLAGVDGLDGLPVPPPEYPPIMVGPSVKELEDDWSRWLVVYPHYLSRDKSRKQGRQVCTSAAVDRVTGEELFRAGSNIVGLRCVFENKCYPRDPLQRGRLRVDANSPYLVDTKLKKSKVCAALCAQIAALRKHAVPP